MQHTNIDNRNNYLVTYQRSEKIVSTDGGRYDVNVVQRTRRSIYWRSKKSEVRRCTWFYKRSSERHLTPFEENTANILETTYRIAFETNKWRRVVVLPNGDSIVFYGPDIFVVVSLVRCKLLLSVMKRRHWICSRPTRVIAKWSGALANSVLNRANQKKSIIYCWWSMVSDLRAIYSLELWKKLVSNYTLWEYVAHCTPDPIDEICCFWVLKKI